MLFFRELGIGLREIKTIIESPAFDRKQAMAVHRKYLVEKQKRIQALVQSVDQTIDTIEKGNVMDTKEMFDGFDQSNVQKYQEEARARWGDTLVDESLRRTSNYGKADWDAVRSETNDINQAIASLMDQDAASPEIQEWVHRWFRLINERFYPCTPETFRGLGDLYVNDSRFKANYDKVKPGLAVFMRKALHAYADRVASEKG